MNATLCDVWRLLTRATRRAVRTLVFASVFAAIWRAPIPWVHRHAGCEQPELDASLPVHVATWHSRGDTEANELHLHFAMLGDIVRGGGCPIPPTEDENDPPFIFTHEVTTVTQCPLMKLVQWIGLTDGPLATVLVEHVCSYRDFNDRPPPQFLSQFAVARSLKSLLSIAQC